MPQTRKYSIHFSSLKNVFSFVLSIHSKHLDMHFWGQLFSLINICLKHKIPTISFSLFFSYNFYNWLIRFTCINFHFLLFNLSIGLMIENCLTSSSSFSFFCFSLSRFLPTFHIISIIIGFTWFYKDNA